MLSSRMYISLYLIKFQLFQCNNIVLIKSLSTWLNKIYVYMHSYAYLYYYYYYYLFEPSHKAIMHMMQKNINAYDRL